MFVGGFRRWWATRSSLAVLLTALARYLPSPADAPASSLTVNEWLGMLLLAATPLGAIAGEAFLLFLKLLRAMLVFAIRVLGRIWFKSS